VKNGETFRWGNKEEFKAEDVQNGIEIKGLQMTTQPSSFRTSQMVSVN